MGLSRLLDELDTGMGKEQVSASKKNLIRLKRKAAKKAFNEDYKQYRKETKEVYNKAYKKEFEKLGSFTNYKMEKAEADFKNVISSAQEKGEAAVEKYLKNSSYSQEKITQFKKRDNRNSKIALGAVLGVYGAVGTSVIIKATRGF